MRVWVVDVFEFEFEFEFFVWFIDIFVVGIVGM